MGSSCFARGNRDTLAALQELLDNDASSSHSLTLAGRLCLGECSTGPILRAGSATHAGITPDTAVEIVRPLIEETADR